MHDAILTLERAGSGAVSADALVEGGLLRQLELLGIDGNRRRLGADIRRPLIELGSPRKIVQLVFGDDRGVEQGQRSLLRLRCDLSQGDESLDGIFVLTRRPEGLGQLLEDQWVVPRELAGLLEDAQRI